MKKEILLIVLMFFVFININFVSAGLEFWQQKMDMGNKTILNNLVFCYDKEMQVNVPNANDYVSGNNFFEAYILYNMYVKSWNEVNLGYMIDWCNFVIQQSSTMANNTILLNETYTQLDDDLKSAKYFVRMKDGDCIFSKQLCKYNIYANQSELDIPIEQQLVTPTWECKACQYYEWSLLSRNIDKTNLINTNTISVSTFIKNLFLLNFEILLMIFWTFLILSLFIAIGLIFIIFYWLFIFLKRLAR
jgi:hypothetical protein